MLGNINKIPDIVVGDLRILTKGTNINLRAEPNTTSRIIANVAATGTEVGRYAKYYAFDGSSLHRWYEFFDGRYGRGWIRGDLATMSNVATTPTPSGNDDAEAQKLLDEIVMQDVETMNNLNTAAAMIPTLQAKGVSTTASANKLTAIFARLKERQDAMQKPNTWGKVKGTVTNAWGSVKSFFGLRGIEGFRKHKNSKFPIFRRKRCNASEIQHNTDIQGIGAVITLTTIAIVSGITLIVGAGTAALVLIKPWKNQSNIDLKESKELKALLENADPAVAQRIREDIKSQLVDAYTVGNRQGSVSSFMSIGKYVLIAGAALWLAPRVLDFLNKK